MIRSTTARFKCLRADSNTLSGCHFFRMPLSYNFGTFLSTYVGDTIAGAVLVAEWLVPRDKRAEFAFYTGNDW